MTFQSPRVMRHLMHALEGSGNYTEAEHFLDSYLFMVENEKKTLAKTGANVQDEDLVPDIDSDEDILRTMSAGVRLLVKYLNKGEKSLHLAQNMEAKCNSWLVEDPLVLAEVWHAVGIANSLWSKQSILFGWAG